MTTSIPTPVHSVASSVAPDAYLGALHQSLLAAGISDTGLMIGSTVTVGITILLVVAIGSVFLHLFATVFHFVWVAAKFGAIILVIFVAAWGASMLKNGENISAKFGEMKHAIETGQPIRRDLTPLEQERAQIQKLFDENK